jgi:hypothetical protein
MQAPPYSKAASVTPPVQGAEPAVVRGVLRLSQGYKVVAIKRSLSGPCGMIPVNDLGLAILGLCNGTLDAKGIENRLREQFGGNTQDLEEFIGALRTRGWISCD